MTNFRWLSGDVDYLSYGGKWISNKYNNGDFDYYLVAELINLEDNSGYKQPIKYQLSIACIAPSEVPKVEMDRALSSCGSNDITTLSEVDKVEVLSDYGIEAVLWCKLDNNFKKLWSEMHIEVTNINMLFGFYMDHPVNRIGAMGWDAIKGDLIPNRLRRG